MTPIQKINIFFKKHQNELSQKELSYFNALEKELKMKDIQIQKLQRELEQSRAVKARLIRKIRSLNQVIDRLRRGSR